GEEVAARLGGHRLRDLRAREDVVAVLTAQALEAELVERTVGPAVAVAQHDPVVAPAELLGQLGDGARDLLGTVVQQRGDRHHVDVPPAAARDLAHVHGERSAGDDRGAHPGRASSSTKRSLKSARPDSSTYCTSRTIERASARSRWLRATIFAPSPATLPADTMRGSARRGTSPMRTALAGER